MEKSRRRRRTNKVVEAMPGPSSLMNASGPVNNASGPVATTPQSIGHLYSSSRHPGRSQHDKFSVRFVDKFSDQLVLGRSDRLPDQSAQLPGRSTGLPAIASSNQVYRPANTQKTLEYELEQAYRKVYSGIRELADKTKKLVTAKSYGFNFDDLETPIQPFFPSSRPIKAPVKFKQPLSNPEEPPKKTRGLFGNKVRKSHSIKTDFVSAQSSFKGNGSTLKTLALVQPKISSGKHTDKTPRERPSSPVFKPPNSSDSSLYNTTDLNSPLFTTAKSHIQSLNKSKPIDKELGKPTGKAIPLKTIKDQNQLRLLKPTNVILIGTEGFMVRPNANTSNMEPYIYDDKADRILNIYNKQPKSLPRDAFTLFVLDSLIVLEHIPGFPL